MQQPVVVVLYVALMVAIIVAVDVLFLRSQFWWRLAFNVGVVALFGIGYVLLRRL